MKRAAIVAFMLSGLALAGELPQGWRDLKFGMTEKQVEQKILAQRTKPDRAWELTPYTAMYVPDLAAKKLVMRDLSSSRFQHWMIGHLDDGATTVRAYFDGGKLIGVRAMGTIDLEAYVKKATAAYGREPERLKLTVSDETSTGKPSDTQQLDAAVWRGPKSTAIIFQPSGWGPELIILSNTGMTAVKKALQSGSDGATRF